MENSKLHHPTLRVLKILETICNNNQGLTLTDISKHTGIAKGTLHPIVTTLINEQYLQINNSVMTLGRKCFTLGNEYAHSLNYLNIVRPYMRKIVAHCNEICQLGVLDGNDVLYVEKIEPDQAIQITSYVGRKLAASATALGKALLTGLSDDEIRAMYVAGLTRYTTKTMVDMEGLLLQVANVRVHGYAHEIGETHIEVECLAVPIKMREHILAAMSVSLPIFRATPEKVQGIVTLLKCQAHDIEQELNALPVNDMVIQY